MKVAVMSDPHFHNYKAHSTIVDGENSRLLDVENTFREIVNQAKTQRCKVLLIAGDIFHVRGQIKPSVMASVMRSIKYATESMEVVLIPGNHDMEDFRGGPTAVDHLAELDNCTVLKKTTVLTTSWGLTVAAIPYCHTKEEFREEAAKIDRRPYEVVMCHQGIDGMGPEGMPATGITTDFMRAVFGEDIPIFCGHYHHCGIEENVVQVGAPLQHDFSDCEKARGFWVYDTKHPEKPVFHPVRVAPEFHSVTTLSAARKVPSGSIVRVKATSGTVAEKMVSLLDKPLSVVVVVEKKYEKAHSRTIELRSVPDMVDQFLKIGGMETSERREIISLYKEVCG